MTQGWILRRTWLLAVAWFIGVGTAFLFNLPGTATAPHYSVESSSDLIGSRQQQDVSERDIVLVFDNSSSAREDGYFMRPEVISNVMPYLHCSWRLGAIVFGETVSRAVELMPPDQWTEEEYQRIVDAHNIVSGSTNFSESLRMAVAMLMSDTQQAQVQRRIVLVTDGNFETGIQSETENQRTAVSQYIEEIIRSGEIELVVLDTDGMGLKREETCQNSPNDSCLWQAWAYKINKGGYDIVEEGGNYLAKLSRAIYTDFDAIYRATKNIPINVLPYRQALKFEVRIIREQVTITLKSPTGDIYSPRVFDYDTYIYDIRYPDPGMWTLIVDPGSNGEYDLTKLEQLLSSENLFPERQLILKREDYSPRLQQGQPLQILFSIRDKDVTGTLISDHFEFLARLLQSGTDDVRSVTVLPFQQPGYQGYYEARLEDTQDLLGAYQLEIEGIVRNAPDLYIFENYPLFFGQIPEFAGLLTVTESDPKVLHPFSVTIRMTNLRLVNSPHIKLRFQGATLDADKPMRCDVNTNLCTVELPTFLSPGDYQLTAILEEGQTTDRVTYPQMTSEILSLHIRDLTDAERYAEQIQMAKIVAEAGGLLLVILLILRYGYPLFFSFFYRVRHGWKLDFNDEGKLLR